jgi:hypothetical protein
MDAAVIPQLKIGLSGTSATGTVGNARPPSPTDVSMRLIGLAVVLAVGLALAPLATEGQHGKCSG